MPAYVPLHIKKSATIIIPKDFKALSVADQAMLESMFKPYVPTQPQDQLSPPNAPVYRESKLPLGYFDDEGLLPPGFIQGRDFEDDGNGGDALVFWICLLLFFWFFVVPYFA